MKKIRIAFVLPGLHRVSRGAEIAFESIAKELTQYKDCDITLFGSGQDKEGTSYKFVHIDNRDRQYFESWPKFPILRSEYIYEEATFSVNFISRYNPKDFDVTLTCSYPFLNWILSRKGGKERPTHIFVTQNGDHPATTNHVEYRFFDCDGLVCTNPEYYERNKKHWECELITNGVDPNRFYPGLGDRAALGLPVDAPIALMVSALIDSKRVDEGIRAVAQVQGLHLVVCGDGPGRSKIQELGNELLPGRFHLIKLSHNQMPDMYRAANVFMHLSLDEPFGNVYLEALATGLPVLAHDCSISRWILEDTSILVDTRDTSQIASGLHRALKKESTIDSGKRVDLIKRRFTWSIIAQNYYLFIQKLLNG
jgi:glycosyltransferase involved in cell wall biosynthesis